MCTRKPTGYRSYLPFPYRSLVTVFLYYEARSVISSRRIVLVSNAVCRNFFSLTENRRDSLRESSSLRSLSSIKVRSVERSVLDEGNKSNTGHDLWEATVQQLFFFVVLIERLYRERGIAASRTTRVVYDGAIRVHDNWGMRRS